MFAREFNSFLNSRDLIVLSTDRIRWCEIQTSSVIFLPTTLLTRSVCSVDKITSSFQEVYTLGLTQGNGQTLMNPNKLDLIV